MRDDTAIDEGGKASTGPTAVRIAAAVAAALILALLVLAYAAYSSYEVVDEGRLLDYTTGTIVEVEVFGSTFYVEKSGTKPSYDLLNSWALTAISSMALLVALFYQFSRSTRSRAKWCYALLFLGAGYLAADELLAIHETLGHNLRSLQELPGVTRPDDVIIASYALPAAIFLFYFRGVLLASRRARILLGIGFALFVITALADIVGGISFEDALEPIASLFLFAGFVALAVDALLEAASEFATRG